MKITTQCPKCQHPFLVAVNGLGRPKGTYPVQIVLNTYHRLQSITATANRLEISKATIWRILKAEGVEIINAKS